MELHKSIEKILKLPFIKLPMKTFLLLSLSFFHFIFALAQSDAKYRGFTDKIPQFSKPCKILSLNVDSSGNGFAEYTNSKKQVLRFQLYNNKVKEALCQIAFEIFYYENNYLRRIESLDINGSLIGCNLSQYHQAATEYIIEKPGLYQKKKKLIDDAEGNIDMKDDSNEQIIRIKLFDSDNHPIKALESHYISSKDYYNNCHRMHWP
jgi:hypothetical protein